MTVINNNLFIVVMRYLFTESPPHWLALEASARVLHQAHSAAALGAVSKLNPQFFISPGNETSTIIIIITILDLLPVAIKNIKCSRVSTNQKAERC
jgi:hypothetical protein